MPARAELAAPGQATTARSFAHAGLIGLIAFLTVVDLFGTQALLPALTASYGVSPAAMGSAVNASTIGMAVAGLAVALFGGRVERRRAIVLALVLLSVPTALLALAPGLAVFAGLRIAQGLCMASAFAFTVAYLGERCTGSAAGKALAAYVTGNVASNLIGRLLAAGLADRFGLPETFLGLAGLNLVGALLVYLGLGPAASMAVTNRGRRSPARVLRELLSDRRLCGAFAIGFCILFAFIGTFTYVNFVLVRPPIGVSQMGLGFVYLVFAPSIATTLLAGHAVARWGVRPALLGALILAGVGLPLLLAPALGAVLAGLTLLGAGTFFAQAVATAYVGREAGEAGSAAVGLYLASYFTGGIVGSVVLGIVFDTAGWPSCVVGIGAALALAAALSRRLASPSQQASGDSLRASLQKQRSISRDLSGTA